MATINTVVTFGAIEAPSGTVETTLASVYTGPDGSVLTASDAYAPVTDASGAMTQALAPVTVTLEGAWTVSVQAVDQNGAVSGAPATGSFSVPPANVSVNIPVSVTVAVA